MKLIVAITGASGSLYADRLLYYLAEARRHFPLEVGVVLSENALTVWEWELQKPFPETFVRYHHKDYFAPFASGSAGYKQMVIVPCSMGTVGRLAAGLSDDLITRAADVVLKEGGKLIVVPRETPLSVLHLENLAKLARLGVVVMPAMPSFYHRPQTVEELVDTVVLRVLDHLGIEVEQRRWGGGGS
jgi:4-hydroxy-3-polyprenylbenzoate decarboxylase